MSIENLRKTLDEYNAANRAYESNPPPRFIKDDDEILDDPAIKALLEMIIVDLANQEIECLFNGESDEPIFLDMHPNGTLYAEYEEREVISRDFETWAGYHLDSARAGWPKEVSLAREYAAFFRHAASLFEQAAEEGRGKGKQ